MINVVVNMVTLTFLDAACAKSISQECLFQSAVES